MQVLDNQIQGFLDSMYVRSQSHDTIRAYRNGLKKFESYINSRYGCQLDAIPARIFSKEIDVYVLLRDFVVDQSKKSFKAVTIEVAVNAAKGYLRYCGVRIYSEDFKQVVKMPRKIKTKEIPLTKELLVRLLRNVSPKLQTVILVATSSGMRIGELVQLTLSDIDFESNPTKITIRAETTKTRTSRETFLTQEATNSLKDYLKRYFGWEENKSNSHLSMRIIFGRTSFSKTKILDETKLKSHSVDAAKSLLQATLDNFLKKIPDLRIKNEDGRNAIHFHAFRKFFRTAVGNAVGRDFAESLIGHRFYMDTYYQLTEDKKREMYRAAEIHLSITNYEEFENNFNKLSKKYSILENRISDLITYLRANSIDIPDFLTLERNHTK